MIPLVNLQRQYAGLKAEIDAAFAAVLERQEFINGREVKAFTAAYLAAFGAKYGTACSNGTTAIELALKGLGVGPGDEVITTAHTFFATVEAIMNVGAEPVFVDIEPGSYTLDPANLPVGRKTRAIMPVQLYGGMADMTAIMAAAASSNLKVIEDAAQAHLATHKGAMAGTIGDAGTFSFYPGKNLGAYGDAGFVIARDAHVAVLISKLADHGREAKYSHDVIGGNARMDELQATVLSVKLKHLKKWTARRQAVAGYYNDKLKRAGFKVIEPLTHSTCVYHLYVIEAADRDAAADKLKAAGIGVGVHYPIPLHKQPALKNLAASNVNLPRTDHAAAHVLSLPICGDITDAEVETVTDAVLKMVRPA
ncbi:MAG: DegT/DnrJ/EryC1/StrS family aminotransferase [Rhodospirillaceae bacterium]|nr:DegT/DnrJ/EryC1/StrS family aminotransferase [Rhodospirillaceae bacterium]